MIGNGSGLITVGIGAFLFGVAYALIVYIPLRGKYEGYTSVLFALGCLVVLAFSSIVIGFIAASIVTMLFIAAGTPMVIGEGIVSKIEQWQHRQAQADAIEKRTQELTEEAYDESEDVAE